MKLTIDNLKGSAKVQRHDLIETYKIITGVYNIPREIFFNCDNSGLRGHEHKLYKKRFRLDVRKFSFSNRAIDAWNSLPALCVNSAINCMFLLHRNRRLLCETWLFTIVGYMAQACAPLRHQGRHLLMLVVNYWTFVPMYFRSREWKFHTWKFRSLELSSSGTFALESENDV